MTRVRRLVWAAVLVLGIGAFAAYRMSSTAEAGAQRGEFGHVPSFALTDQMGRTVTDKDLRGSAWVANFVFTRCPSVCPMLTAKFQALQTKLGKLPGVRYVSISVDPEYDTPQVLAEYAQRFSADSTRWQFLTGPLKDIEKTVVNGFKIHMGQPQKSESDPTLVEIMHGEHFVLVDGEGVIRGYYRADQSGLAELERDVRDLAD
jgi:protein SCO1/2